MGNLNSKEKKGEGAPNCERSTGKDWRMMANKRYCKSMADSCQCMAKTTTIF